MKPEYGSHGHGTSSPGATYYYQQPSAQYMMPYSSHQSSHHSQSMVYQSVSYQTPYTSSYSPGGSNSDFTDNPAMYYVKQPYLNYTSHNSHHSNSHSISHSNSSERNYAHSSSDPSVVPSALQPTMSYNGNEDPSTLTCFATAFLINYFQHVIYFARKLLSSIIFTISQHLISNFNTNVLSHTGANSNVSSSPGTPTTSTGSAHSRYYSGGGWQQQHQM